MARFYANGIAARLSASAKAYAGDESGTTAVEFSIVSVPFLGLLFMIFQISYLALVQQGLDYAAERGARAIKTGQINASSYSGATASANGAKFCANVLAQYLPSFLNCSSLIVDVRTATTAAAGDTNVWTSLNSATLNAAQTYLTSSNVEFCVGQPGSIVAVRVVYPVPPTLSIMTLNGSLANISASTAGQVNNPSTNTMVHPIMGVFAFQSEPYTATSATTLPGCSSSS